VPNGHPCLERFFNDLLSMKSKYFFGEILFVEHIREGLVILARHFQQL
jgi:hypothetical protein